MSICRESFLRSVHRSSVERANRQVLEIVPPPILRMKGIKENVRSFRAWSLDFPLFSRLRNYEGLFFGRMLLQPLSPLGAHTLSLHSKVLLTWFIKSSLSYCNQLSRMKWSIFVSAQNKPYFVSLYHAYAVTPSVVCLDYSPAQILLTH